MDSHHRKQELTLLPTGRHLRSSRKREQRILNNYSMYLAYYSHAYQFKNRLERAIQHYLKNIDRTLIEDEDFKGFITKVIADLKKLNEKYSRCTPKDPSLCKIEELNDKDFTLFGTDCVSFHFYYSDKVN